MAIDWNNIRTIKNGASKVGWVVYPKNKGGDALNAYLIFAKNDKPVEIVSHYLSSQKAITLGKGMVGYNRKAFVSGQEKKEIIDLDKQTKITTEQTGEREVRRLAELCECCGTLPCVVIYGKKKKKALYVNSMSFSPDNLADVVYVPMWEMGGGTGGGGGQEGGGNNDPGSEGDGFENDEIIDLSKFEDWTIIGGTYLYSPDNFPGKEQGFPWKWWQVANLNDHKNLETGFFNLEHLNLTLDISRWLLLNPEINKEIQDFLLDKDLEKEALIAAKTFVLQLSSASIYTPEDVKNVEFLQASYAEFDCCPPTPMTPAAYVADLTVRMAFIKRDNPNWSWMKCCMEANYDIVHFSLDVLGMIPVGGEIFDVVNGVLYVVRGQGINATLSFVSAIPGASWFTMPAKWARKVIQMEKGGRATLTWYKGANNVITFGSENSKQFRKILELPKGDPRQAHHVIPWELANDGAQEVIQKAAQARFPFHPQDALNGIPINTSQHLGSHPNYTRRVSLELEKIKLKHGANLTPEIAFQEVVNLTNKIKQAIKASPNTPIDHIIF